MIKKRRATCANYHLFASARRAGSSLFPSFVATFCAIWASLLPAAAASLTYSDGICEYRVSFDAKAVDRTALASTFAYLNDSMVEADFSPDFSSASSIASADLGRCTAHRDRLRGVRLIAAEGLATVRDKETNEIDKICRRNAAMVSLARGDVAPARAAAPACTRYADLLALPPDKFKVQWNDLVVDLCQASTEVNICAGHLQRSGEGPGSEMRRKLAVLQRWSECATPAAPPVDIDSEKRTMRERLAKRFKAKALSCAQ